MRIIAFFKNWTLPVAMLAGALGYWAYVSVPAFDCTHAAMSTFISYVQPLLLFAMLFVSFCKVSLRQLKPKAWMLEMLAVQVLCYIAMGLVIILCKDMPGRAIIESAMICMICPTATAASVVTAKLGGNANVVVSYTCLINLAVSLVVPMMVPWLNEEGTGQLGFEASFLLILGKVFPLLIMPLVCAWFMRHLFPKAHSWIVRHSSIAFYLWAVALALAIAVTTKAVAHSDESLWVLIGIALVSLATCVLQFWMGHVIGKKHGETIAGTQGFGQKNTVFAIWMAYTFMNPVTAMAGGFYSVWHNVVNSWQLYKVRRRSEGHL